MALDSNSKLEVNKFILHIETASKVCSVALSNNGELIGCKETSSEEYIHSEALTLYIQEVLDSVKVDFKDLCAISISSGPGSYTGLRIGLSTAKGLCFALDIPLISIQTLSSLHALVDSTKMSVIPMLDARRMEVYAEVYDAYGEILQGMDSIIIHKTSFLAFEPFMVLGDGASKCKEIWEGREIVWRDELVSSARGQVALAYEKFKKQDFENLAYFIPIYLKDANGVRP